ncbi:nicotinamide-nucleotide amidohydrolase family protein [Salinicola sp. RZ23]|uniref:CinA family protein n=1 Tax=Salinicola sp. RZ23 TaxID=1949087 RepID=UPI000DA1EAFA|nr:nicotinamide-nucleotide amidohydrolase family protein [Salinicola sp. RZ23]
MSLPTDHPLPPGSDQDPQVLARRLGEACLAAGCFVTTAESCTGGGVAEAITAIAGSSGYFASGYVTYANAAKQRMLGVSEQTLAAHGAVSAATVREMVAGACRDSGAELGVAISGVAGPGGGGAEKPVGTVWFAWGDAEAQRVACFRLPGERATVRAQAVAIALAGLLESLVAEA